MSDIKTTNRGGTRKGAGRPSSFKIGTDGSKVKLDYKPKINPVKELEKLYKEISKVKTKDELLIVQAKIDLLNKLLPYTAMKKPTASLEQNIDKVPEHTILKIVNNDGTSTSKKQESSNVSDQEDFV